MSTNTSPRSAARYRNQFSHKLCLWLCSSLVKSLAVDLNDPGLILSQGDFFHFNYFLRGNAPNGEQQQQQGEEQELK